MTNGFDDETADLDRTVRKRLAAAGPIDSAHFDPQVLRDACALAARWRATLCADAASSQAEADRSRE